MEDRRQRRMHGLPEVCVPTLGVGVGGCLELNVIDALHIGIQRVETVLKIQHCFVTVFCTFWSLIHVLKLILNNFLHFPAIPVRQSGQAPLLQRLHQQRADSLLQLWQREVHSIVGWRFVFCRCAAAQTMRVILSACLMAGRVLFPGLKPGQRKVLFTCLKRNDKREVKVAQLAGSVAEMSAYHHGEVQSAWCVSPVFIRSRLSQRRMKTVRCELKQMLFILQTTHTYCFSPRVAVASSHDDHRELGPELHWQQQLEHPAAPGSVWYSYQWRQRCRQPSLHLHHAQVRQRWTRQYWHLCTGLMTKLISHSPLAKLLFPAVDSNLLKFLYDDNQKVEPEWYIPIIPMVLVNGAEGIGTGWACKIPNYDVREIVNNINRMLNHQDPLPMVNRLNIVLTFDVAAIDCESGCANWIYTSSWGNFHQYSSLSLKGQLTKTQVHLTKTT